MTDSISPSTSTDPATERERVRQQLASTIDTVHERIQDADPESPDEEQMLIRWTRTLGYLSGQYRKLLKDRDLDEMQDELELLQRATDVTETDQ